MLHTRARWSTLSEPFEGISGVQRLEVDSYQLVSRVNGLTGHHDYYPGSKTGVNILSNG